MIYITVCKAKGIESMWNDHWSIMKPAYFIIWFSFNIDFRFSIKWYSRAQKVILHKYVKYTAAVWKQYNKMAILHFFLLNSTLIYILLSMCVIFVFNKIFWHFVRKWINTSICGQKVQSSFNMAGRVYTF